jgi:hypothetical protein
MAPMEYFGAWGTLIHEKNLKSKISCQTPFNVNGDNFIFGVVVTGDKNKDALEVGSCQS